MASISSSTANKVKKEPILRLFTFLQYSTLFLLLTIFIVTSNSCQSSKYLNKGEYLLQKNTFQFEGDISKKDRQKLERNINTLNIQKPNTKWLFIPREYIYYKNTEPGDSSWFNRFARKRIGEAPSLYNPKRIEKTRTSIEKFLINKKGYFHASVDTATQYDKLHRGYSVVYKINLHERFVINSLKYTSKDKVILDLIHNNLYDAHINVGDPIDENHFNLELSRISNLLQDNGYANFNSKFITIQGDSTNSSEEHHIVDMILDINTPIEGGNHNKYKVGNIYVHTDYNRLENILTVFDTTMYNDLAFIKSSAKHIVKKELLSTMIHTRPGELYSKADRQKTYRKLLQLTPYKYININSTIDKINNLVHYNIYLLPHKKLWTGTVAGDFYFSGSETNKIGISANKRFSNKNTFGGAENYFLDLDASLEFQLLQIGEDAKKEIRTNQDFSIQNKLEFPKLFDLTREFAFLRKTRLLSKKQYKSIKDESITSLKGGYNYTNLIGFYKYHKFNLSMGYDYQPSQSKRLTFEPIAFTVFNPTPSEVWLATLKKTPLTAKGFEPSFVSGLIFSNLSYLYSKSTQSGIQYNWLSAFELSGFENFIINRFTKEPWITIAGVEFSKFIKLESSFSSSKRITQKLVIAGRVNAGWSTPYGSSLTIPYFKQFFIGGPNSIRAWQDRELGPGEYFNENITADSIRSFYQTGDIKMEANIEVRQDLFQNNTVRVEIAAFIDAGNIWTSKEDTARLGTKITNKFYNQIAIGAGYGFRFDFGFVLLRVDTGYKLRNPYITKKNPYYWKPKNSLLGNINIAINYPF